MQGLKSLNVQFRTCPGKPKTFLRAIIRLFVEVLSVFGLFSGPKSIFIVIFYVRYFELNMCDEAQINLKIRKKAPENVGLLFYRPSHFIKTNFGICLAKNLNFFSKFDFNVVFFEVFSHCAWT